MMGQTNEKKKYIVYMYTFPNGKRYVGKTSRTLRIRQGHNWENYDECPALFNAIQKYGIKNIKQEILVEGLMTKDESSEIEKYYIALYKTNCNRYRNPEYGYNLTDGGDDGAGPRPSYQGDGHPNAKPVYYIEMDKYYGSALTAQQETGFNKNSIGACCRLQCYCTHHPNNYDLVSHWLFADEVTEENIQKALAGPPPRSNERAVYCIEIDKYFANSSEAERQTGVCSADIRYCCRGEYISTGRYSADMLELHWLWADDVNDDNIMMTLQRKYIPYNAQRVYCIEADKYFDTELEGAKYGGVTDIKKSLNYYGYAGGKHPVTGEPLHWLRAKEVNDDNISKVLDIAENLKEDAIRRFRKKVDGKRYGEKNGRAKFTEDDVKAIIQRLLNGEKVSKIAIDYDDRRYAISDIKNHRAWVYLTKDIVFT